MHASSQQSLPELERPPCILIVEARYYPDINDALLAGARHMLEKAGAKITTLSLSGALEIPGAISIAHEKGGFDGYVALGCVIRGETLHFDIVAQQSAAGLMQLSVEKALAIGNGILTVETMAQAKARALPESQDKGGLAARACLELLAWKQTL